LEHGRIGCAVARAKTGEARPLQRESIIVNASIGFRTAVVLHFGILYVLTFGMKSTLLGFWHYIAAVGLSLLMAAIVALFVADMASPNSPRLSRAIDAIIGIGWSAVVGFLISNSWHTTGWVSN
jgi:hypothetical protein